MKQPVNEWKPYVPICLEELHTDTIYKNEYSIYIVSRDKRKYWEIITEMYQYMRKLYGKNHPRYERRLQTILYHAEAPYKLNIRFATDEITVWSSDPAVQQHSKQLFKNWKQLEEYYNDLLVYCRWKPEHDRQLAEAAKEQARLKEERRIKRLSNDPDNPAARKRKARRHLQRLGYDLHKSRKIAKTEDDRGLYQIVKLDTGEIIAGQKFDLTLEQVERFYMDADYEIVEKQDGWYRDQTGFLFNREPDLKKRKEKAIKALSKMGYVLEIESDTFGGGETEYYRSYHTGGVAGDNPTLKQNEIIAKLEKGEVIIPEKQQNNLYEILDTQETMLAKYGALFGTVQSTDLVGSKMQEQIKQDVQQTQSIIKQRDISIENNLTIPVQVLQKLDQSEIKKLTKDISKHTVSEINEVFRKNGMDSVLNPLRPR